MTNLQKILYDRIMKASEYINKINVFGYPETEIVDGKEVYSDTGNVCSVDLKKKQLHDDAIRRWKPVVEKILGTGNPEKNEMLSEYAQAHHDAIHRHEMSEVLAPKAQFTGLELLPNTLKICAQTYLNDDFIGIVKTQDIDKEDTNVDDHF